MSLLKTILQGIYPSLCRQCETLVANNDIFCTQCIATLKPIPSIVLPIKRKCAMKVFAVSAYQHPVKTLITKKFSGDLLACKQLADLMLALTPLRTLPADVIVPIPLHWTRYAQRGFNQSYQIAKELTQHLHIPTMRLLTRTRRTTFQWKLSGAQRQNNVADAFSIHPWYRLQKTNNITGKHVILIDDLCTTGATLTHAAKIIAAQQPASLTAFVGCRAI